MSDDDPIRDALKKVFNRLDGMPVALYGTIVQASPVKVALDADIDTVGNPVTRPAQSSVGPLTVGQRVYCLSQSRRVVVISAFPRRAPLVLLNDFTPHPAGLTVVVSAGRVDLAGSMFRATAPTGFTTAAQLPEWVPRPAAQARFAGRDDAGLWVVVTDTGLVQVKATSALKTGLGYAVDGAGYAF